MVISTCSNLQFISVLQKEIPRNSRTRDQFLGTSSFRRIRNFQHLHSSLYRKVPEDSVLVILKYNKSRHFKLACHASPPKRFLALAIEPWKRTVQVFINPLYYDMLKTLKLQSRSVLSYLYSLRCEHLLLFFLFLSIAFCFVFMSEILHGIVEKAATQEMQENLVTQQATKFLAVIWLSLFQNVQNQGQ